MDDPTSDNLKARQIWLVIMALMVSVVGIANSMLMSVTERFREIGTMKCLGALDKFIVKLFLFESALLGLLGSLLGALLGILVMWLVLSFRYNFDPPYLQFLEILLLSGALGLILAVVAAILPAREAARMPAAAALRVDV
jgi:ABC-type lipoprotein release transport system permease subunit